MCGGTGHDSESCRKHKSKPVSNAPPTKKWVPKKALPVKPLSTAPKPVSPVIAVSTATAVRTTPVEIPHKLQVSWNKNGTYTQVNTPAKHHVTMSRQEITQAGQNSVTFSQYTFLDALKNATPKDANLNTVGRKSFKYFSMWSQVDEFLPCVQNVWTQYWDGTKMFRVVMKLKQLKNPLKDSNSKLFADIGNSSIHAGKALDNIQSQLKLNPIDPVLIEQDVLKGRYAQNKIFSIADTRGTVHRDGDHIQQAFLAYYEGSLGSTAPTTKVSNAVVQVGNVSTTAHHDILLALVSKKEVKDAIFSIPNHKAPGPDGYSSAFFKDARSIVGDEQVNHTFISLLPKCDMPQNVTQFIPIACCNVLYKAISKILCTRLVAVLPTIMLVALTFPQKFINLVMVCVISVSYSLVLIGMNFGYFKGDTTSIMILLRAFATFTAATGLHMNNLKSNIYFNGVAESVKQDILQVSGFVEGTLPFKYLGVPISAGRLSVKHYSILIEKITARITGFGAKKLSYAGRLTPVSSVLSSLSNYWASIFLLPKCVIRKVEALCRNYLWDGSPDYIRVPMVSWRKSALQNVKEGTNWSSYKPKNGTSWVWKAICKVKEKYGVAYLNGQWRPHPKGKALMLKDRLASLGISTDDKCLLCGIDTETHEHFFQHCGFTKMLLCNLMRLLNIRRPGSDALQWVQSKPWSAVKKNVVIAFIQAVLYAVWIQRNKARIDFTIDRPEVVAQVTL
ncbi:uncharacterized protein LOC141607501 [Silene latifolia]|uniref:uncharacterized protein LOC141607501 n=1 Tax=Silene latifolia TaxID=37657 RepID=UPI003D775330